MYMYIRFHYLCGITDLHTVHVYVHMWVYTYSTFIQNWVVILRLDGTIPVGILSEAVQYQLHLHVHVHVIIGYQ